MCDGEESDSSKMPNALMFITRATPITKHAIFSTMNPQKNPIPPQKPRENDSDGLM